ncbi:cytochrome c maturation protein CcmE [Natronospirillum operosum]|uniref:Cytochrome c-type biogenesis protein CcmE n=1 Tax=Natronospirillum operosum TaxID=2759953 RepID=A0A4Z0WHF8_9GAMM|nr:cytochrome c maturation protein CcmE [Natronospirillum operosum]TGG95367.1 cytochrome c maturation protein CcmE [Natronospirillum operosum]
MNPARKQRLILILLAVGLFTVSVILLLIANRNQVNLFYSPTDIVEGEAPLDRSFRAGGVVVHDSVWRDTDTLAVTFTVSDNLSEVTMTYTGILPDLFKEGQGVVATGTLNENGIFQASEVLARHDENYMPPEVARALEEARRRGQTPDYNNAGGY